MYFIKKGVLNTNMIFGYARVSSKEQSLKRQIKELEEKGVDKKNIYKEFGTGKSFQNRIEYQKMLDNCKVGDTIYFTSLDRFSRNVRESVKQLEILENRGLKAVFLKENISTEMKGIAQLIISIFSWVAEQERITLLERQKKGYNALKRDAKGRLISKKGKVLGKPALELNKNQLKLVEEYKQGKLEISKTDLAKLLGISRSALYKKVLTNEISK